MGLKVGFTEANSPQLGSHETRQDVCFQNTTVGRMVAEAEYLNGLVISPTFFNLSLNFEIRTSRSEPQ